MASLKKHQSWGLQLVKADHTRSEEEHSREKVAHTNECPWGQKPHVTESVIEDSILGLHQMNALHIPYNI